MKPTFDIEKLYTVTDLLDGILRCGEKGTLDKMCYLPADDETPADAAGAIICFESLFGTAQDVEKDLTDREMTIILDWAERWFKGSASSLIRFYDSSLAPENSSRSVVPHLDNLLDYEDFSDEPMEEPRMQLLVVPLRPKWARKNGSARSVLFDEHIGIMAEAYFGPEGRGRHAEALEASWREHLQKVSKDPGVRGPLPNRLAKAIHDRLAATEG